MDKTISSVLTADSSTSVVGQYIKDAFDPFVPNGPLYLYMRKEDLGENTTLVIADIPSWDISIRFELDDKIKYELEPHQVQNHIGQTMFDAIRAYPRPPISDNIVLGYN